MRRELFAAAMLRFCSGVALTGLLLFLPAGTLDWWQGWLLMGVLFAPMFCAGLVMLFRSPELLRRRLSAREGEAAQRRVVLFSALMFLAAFVLAGLNRRFGWIILPGAVSWVAAAVFMLGYLLYAEVLRENAWLSRTVEVRQGQKVVDTGLYGVVRHPMYLSTLLLFLSMPLILGSIPSLIAMLIYPVILRGRIVNEEAVLSAGLEGYADYMKKVRYRVIPFVW